MPFLQLFVLAVVAMVGLATLRLIRVHLGRTPLPEERGRRLFLLAFVLVPPILLGALIQPGTLVGPISGIAFLPVYAMFLGVVVVVMFLAAQAIELMTNRRWGQLARLALVGSEGDPGALWVDPPVTATLAEGVEIVDGANAAFPRGREFPLQIDRPGFRHDWDALDVATRTLEGRIANDHRLGLPVASAATDTASDARSRLDTLRGLASAKGQAWGAAG